MNEEKKPAALDEDALESVTGGITGGTVTEQQSKWIKRAWDRINGRSGSGDDTEQKEQQL